MNDQDIMAFLGTLTDTQKEKLLACTSADELEQILDDYDIEIPDEMLEAIAGGRGRFVPTLLAGIIMLSGAGTMIASPSGGTIFEELTITAYAADWKKEAASGAIDGGIQAITARIPLIGNSISLPVSNMLKDALGLSENKEITFRDISVQISDVSKQIADLSNQMTALNLQLEQKMKAEMREQTWRVIEEVENEEIVGDYKNAMERLSIGGDFSLRKCTEMEGVDQYGVPYNYNKDEKIFILASALGNDSTWGNEGSVVFNLTLVGRYMSGENYRGNKDFYTALCECGSIRKDCLFYDETQERADMYITYMMRDYLATYAIAMESLQAQDLILYAKDNGDTEVFNPQNLRPSLADAYKSFVTTSASVNSTRKKLTNLLYGGSDPQSKCVFTVYQEFTKHNKGIYIDSGSENTQLIMNTRSVAADKSVYDAIYKNNYLTGDKLQTLINAARSADMSIAQYFAAHNNPLPADVQYLLVGRSEVEKVVLADDVNWKQYKYYDIVYAIDVNDVTLTHQALNVSEYTETKDGIIKVDRYVDARTNHPMNILTIQTKAAASSNPFGNLADDHQYHLLSGRYELIKDFYANGTIVIDEGCEVVIDLAGHTLNRNLSTANSVGSVIKVKSGARLTIIDSSVANSGKITGGYSNSNGGALDIEIKAEVTLRGITLTGNKAAKKGGAIFNDGRLTLESCTFLNNSANDGGAIYNGVTTYESGRPCQERALLISGSTFKGNSAVVNGGGAITNYGTLNIIRSLFEGNSAKQDGGAVWSKAALKIKDSTITKNKTQAHGGGVSIANSRSDSNNNRYTDLINCVVTYNEAAGSGGGLHTHGETIGLEAQRCQFDHNKANHGGGVMIGTNSNPYSFEVWFTDCSFCYNEANGDGGGLNTWEGDESKTQKVYLTRCKLNNNHSKGWGGGYRTQADVEMKECEILNNVADKNGGGIYNHMCIEMIDCIVSGNHASSSGGGISHAEAKSGYYPTFYDGDKHSYLVLRGNTRIENNYANGKESSIIEVGKKADVIKYDNAYIGPGYHVG